MSLSLLSLENKIITINEEALKFLDSISDEIILISIFTSTNLKEKNSSFKSNLIQNLLNSNYQNKNKNGISIVKQVLNKQNSSSKILLINVQNCDKNILSSLFFISSVFIFIIDKDFDANSIEENFSLISSLPSTIETKKVGGNEIIFTECSPKLIFYVENSQIKSNSTKDYLENFLHNNKNLTNSNIIKFFTERDIVLNNENNFIQKLKKKIAIDANAKNIRGKMFNGNSLMFFLRKFYEKTNSQLKPNFDSLFEDLIKNDINFYKNLSLNFYNSSLNKIKIPMESIDLIKKLFSIKTNSIEKLNEIFKLNVDSFNNSEYLMFFNESKREIENEIEINEKKLEEENDNNSVNFNNNLLKKLYENINNKISNENYNKNNIDEYLNDYNNFINNYKEKSLGKTKIVCLNEFLKENKKIFFDYFINKFNEENNKKINDLKNKINDLNNNNKNDEEEFNNKNEEGEEIEKKIENLNSNIEKKKRQIKNIQEQIDEIDNQIKKEQNEDPNTIPEKENDDEDDENDNKKKKKFDENVDDDSDEDFPKKKKKVVKKNKNDDDDDDEESENRYSSKKKYKMKKNDDDDEENVKPKSKKKLENYSDEDD